MTKFELKKIHLNIGTVVFGAIFIYLLITLLMYAFRTHVDTYQVVSGPLSSNDTYTALIIRDESVVKSSASGYVNFYISNSGKVAKGDLICGVSSEEMPVSSAEIKESDYNKLRTLAASSSKQFSSIDFNEIYNLRYSVLNILWNSDAVDSASGNYYSAREDGIVSTLIDGFENYTEDDLSPDMGQNSELDVKRLSNHDNIKAGDSLFRLVSGEKWYIYFPITDEQLVKLASHLDSSIKVKFLNDENSESGFLSFLEVADQKYGKITFESGLIRYVDERFADVEIVTNMQTGLRIPVSALVKKEFYTIPVSFLEYSGDDNSEAGFIREVRNEDGKKTTEFVSATVYDISEPDDEDTEALYYVDKGSFKDGDVLVSSSSDSKYTIGSVGSLQGVYCVNRGYTVFRMVKIIDKNSDYCIVEEGTDYGLSLYDYIVTDGSSVKENQIVQ